MEISRPQSPRVLCRVSKLPPAKLRHHQFAWPQNWPSRSNRNLLLSESRSTRECSLIFERFFRFWSTILWCNWAQLLAIAHFHIAFHSYSHRLATWVAQWSHCSGGDRLGRTEIALIILEAEAAAILFEFPWWFHGDFMVIAWWFQQWSWLNHGLMRMGCNRPGNSVNPIWCGSWL